MLQLVVQHADVELRDVATWLQLSKSVRAALQQAVGSVCVETTRMTTGKLPDSKYLTALAHWLPRHAGLVSTLKVWIWQGIQRSATDFPAFEEMLSLSMQASCSRRPATGTITTQQAPAWPLLQLKAFKTNFVFQPAALEALASSSCLTELSLRYVPPQRFTAELCAALGNLRGLRKLDCWPQDPSAPGAAAKFPPEFAAAVAELTQLQELSAEGLVPASSLALLPASLTELTLIVGHAPAAALAPAAAGAPVNIHLGHLSKLQSLSLTVPDGISLGSQLPACLTKLTLVGPAEPLNRLPSLQCLHLPKAYAATSLLQHLEQQPQLQQLSLGLHGSSPEQLQQVADALSRCKQLTQLHLFNQYCNLEMAPWTLGAQEVNLRGVRLQLQDLRQLQRLKLAHIKWGFAGFSQLTVLSSLTALELDSCDIASAGLAAAFQRLTGLRELRIPSCMPDNDCLVGALGCLTNLEGLVLLGNRPRFSDAILPLLSPLTKLTHLSLYEAGHDDESDSDNEADEQQQQGPPSAAARRQFLAGMPHLDSIDWC
jgi:hypothetical protein